MTGAGVVTAGEARVLVLGPSRLAVGRTVARLGPGQRRLLARLAASPRALTLDEIAVALWDGARPPSARATIHNHVSRLRRLGGTDLITTAGDGYRLAVPTDVDELRTAVRDAEAVLAADPARALALAEHAQALPAGVAFADLVPGPLAAGLREEADGLPAAAADSEVEAAFALGLTARALSAAQRSTAVTPCDEGRAIRYAQGLDRAGRRGEALAELARVRRALRTELGLDATPALAAVESAIRGAAVPAADDVPAVELEQVLHAVSGGRSVVVSATWPAAVPRLLAAAHEALAVRGDLHVATTQVRGYRDVAVAALLDLLDLLGLEIPPELGPVGTFVAAVTQLAQTRPVVLVVDGFDVAGPSTRHALLEAAAADGVTLLAGLRHELATAPVAPFEAAVVIAGRDDEAARTAAMRALVAGLPRETRDTLTAVAVAGDGVRTAALAGFGMTAGLEDAARRGLLRTDDGGAVAYADGALRALVAADTPTGVRQELHHALGRALARLGPVEDAAHHLLAAGEIEPAAAVRAARAAAAAAAVAGAPRDAGGWLRRAAAVNHDPRTAIAIDVELGDALRLAGDPSHVAVLQAAAADAMRHDDEELLGEAAFALLQLGGTTVSTTVDRDVEALLDRTLSRLRDRRRIALVTGAASLAFSMTGTAGRSRALFDAAEAAADDPATRRRVLPFAYMSIGTPGDLDRRRRLTAELLDLAAAADDPVAAFEGLHLAASVQLQDGDGDALRRTWSDMAALVDRVGDVGRRWTLHYLAAAIAHLDGDGDRVEALSQRAFAQLAPVSPSRATAALSGQLFGLRLSQGRTAELRPALEALVADQPGVPAWIAALAIATVDDDPQEAVALARRALDAAEVDLTWLVAQLVSARAVALAVRRGADDGGLLQRCREALEPWSGRVSWQGTCSYGPVDTMLALLADVGGDAAGARRLAGAALAQAERLRAPVFADELRALGVLAPA